MTDLIEVPITGRDPLQAHASRCPSPRASAFLLPALGVAARHYTRFADALAREGIEAFALAPRPHVSRALPGGGYAQRAEDAATVIRALTTPGRPRLLVGHSLGAQVGALLASREPELLDGLVFVAAGTPNVRCFPFGMRSKINVVRTVAALSPALGHFPGKTIGFGERESPVLMREWATLAGQGKFVIDGHDVASDLARVTTPTLAVEIEGDLMAPPVATTDLLARLSSAPVARVMLGPPALPAEACDHVRWLKHPDAVVAAVATFLRDQQPRRESAEAQR